MTKKNQKGKRKKVLKILVFVAATLLVLYTAFIIIVSTLLSRGYEYRDIKVSVQGVRLILPFYASLSEVKVESEDMYAEFERVSFFSLLPTKAIDYASISNGKVVLSIPDKQETDKDAEGVDSKDFEEFEMPVFKLPFRLFAKRLKLSDIDFEVTHPEYSLSVTELSAGIRGLSFLTVSDFSSKVYVSQAHIVFKNEHIDVETNLAVDGKIRGSSNRISFESKTVFSPFSTKLDVAKIDYDVIKVKSSFILAGKSLELTANPVFKGLAINEHRMESLDFIENELVITAQAENIFSPESFFGAVNHLEKEIAKLDLELNPKDKGVEVDVVLNAFEFKAENDVIAFLNTIDDLRVHHLTLNFNELSTKAKITPKTLTIQNFKGSLSAKCNATLLNEFRLTGFSATASTKDLEVDYKSFAVNGKMDINGSASAGYIPVNIRVDKTNFFGTFTFNNKLWPNISSGATVEYRNNLIRSNVEFYYTKNEFRNIRYFLRNHKSNVRIRLNTNLRSIFGYKPPVDIDGVLSGDIEITGDGNRFTYSARLKADSVRYENIAEYLPLFDDSIITQGSFVFDYSKRVIDVVLTEFNQKLFIPGFLETQLNDFNVTMLDNKIIANGSAKFIINGEKYIEKAEFLKKKV